MRADHGYPRVHKQANNHQVDSSPEWRRHRHQLQKMRGSRKGYNADIDDTPALLEEDEVSESAATGSNSVERVHFYSHVVPRRRVKKIRRSIAPSAHPDIDLSMVSLLSSKELDQRFLACGSCTSATLPPLGINSDDSSSSGNSQVDYKIIVNETKHAYPAARPLAVIDYGSIELDMSGSLLDSIYKIDAIGVSRGGSEDLVIGGRRFSFNDKSKTKNHDDAVGKSRTRASGTAETAYSATSILNPGAFSVANHRSPEVASVIVSLKSIAGSEPATLATHSRERSDCKKQKIPNAHIKKSACIPIVVKVPTTLEAAISFSPFARVLFCAQAPYTILHANAAYETMVLNGLAKSCGVGESFSSNEPNEGESSENYISRTVGDHISWPGHSLPGFVQIFHVMSSDETYSQFIRDYRSAFHCRRMDTPRLCYVDASAHGSSSQVTHEVNILKECVSHYLLQIRSC